MKIDKAIAEAQTFSKLCEIVEKPKLRLTFWGGHYFSVVGYEGEIDIDDLAMRVSKMAESNFEFSETDRPYGKQISQKIRKIYSDFAQLSNQGNWLTAIFILLWKWRYLNPYLTPWSKWCQYGERTDYFENYTRSQFQGVFGCSPEDAIERRGFSLRQRYKGVSKDWPERWRILKKPEYTVSNQLYWFFQDQKAKVFPPLKEEWRPYTSEVEWKSTDYIDAAAD